MKKIQHSLQSVSRPRHASGRREASIAAVIQNLSKRVAWTGSLAKSPDSENLGKQVERFTKSKRDDSARDLGEEIQEHLCSPEAIRTWRDCKKGQ